MQQATQIFVISRTVALCHLSQGFFYYRYDFRLTNVPLITYNLIRIKQFLHIV